MKMKLSMIFKVAVLSLGSVSTVSAQDVLVTQQGDVHKVYEIEIGGSSIFYKLENTPNATMRLEAIRKITTISCRCYPKSFFSTSVGFDTYFDLQH